jgi:hypothetical protein
MGIIRNGLISSGVIPGYRGYDYVEYIYSGTSTTFTVPFEGISYMTFETWGGGGKGFGDRAPTNMQESYPGGGGGAYAKTTIYSPQSGNQFSLSVGQGSTVEGTSGGTTTISSGVTVYCRASGGQSPSAQGSGGIGGLTSLSVGDIKYAGGNGGNGCTSDCGLPGGAGGGGAGSTGAASGSVGNDEFGGSGGSGGATASPVDTFNNGNPGNAYGAGGGGGSSYNRTNCSGGNGANGLIRIIYYL